MTVGTRWSSIRLDQKMSAALREANRDIVSEYESAVKEVTRDIESDIRASGRGGDHNAEFAHQDVRVWRAGSGRFNILTGWLNPPSHAHERGGGGRLWYQYQDAGFHMFGGERWIEGVGATIDRRENVIAAVQKVNRKWLRDIERALN